MNYRLELCQTVLVCHKSSFKHSSFGNGKYLKYLSNSRSLRRKTLHIPTVVTKQLCRYNDISVNHRETVFVVTNLFVK